MTSLGVSPAKLHTWGIDVDGDVLLCVLWMASWSIQWRVPRESHSEIGGKYGKIPNLMEVEGKIIDKWWISQ